MCKGSALIAVDHDGVEGACGGREVLSIGLLMRPGLDRGRSCKWVIVFEAYAEPSIPKQPAPECSTDVPIMVPTPPINVTFPCCLGCEVLNKPVTKLVPIKEEHPMVLPCDNQGQGARIATVCSGQCACHGGHSDRQGYRSVAHMQLSSVPRHEYPD